MKYVSDTAAIETIRGAFVRCDLAPLLRERRHLVQAHKELLHECLDRDEEDEQMYGNKEIIRAIRSWLSEGEKREQERKL